MRNELKPDRFSHMIRHLMEFPNTLSVFRHPTLLAVIFFQGGFASSLDAASFESEVGKIFAPFEIDLSTDPRTQSTSAAANLFLKKLEKILISKTQRPSLELMRATSP